MPKDARCETNYFNHNLFIFVSVYSMCFRGLNESAERQVTVNANVTTAQRENITDIGQQFASFSYPKVFNTPVFVRFKTSEKFRSTSIKLFLG